MRLSAHPNVNQLRDVFLVAGSDSRFFTLWQVHQDVDPDTTFQLTEVVEDFEADELATVAIVQQILKGLKHFHENNIKLDPQFLPRSIFLERETGCVRILNALDRKSLMGDDEGTFAQEGTEVTLHRAPEIFAARSEPTLKVDIYSLGIIGTSKRMEK